MRERMFSRNSRTQGLLLIFFLVRTEVALAQVYSVQGHLSYETLGPVPKFRQEYDFTVGVSNTWWAIDTMRTGELKKTPGPPILHHREVFQGDAVYAYAYFSQPAISTNAERTDGIIRAELNRLPSFDRGGFPSVLWLAYASTRYLDGITNHSLRVITSLDDARRRAGFQTPAKWERLGRGDGLPGWVDYYYNESAWRPASQPDSFGRGTETAAESTSPLLLWASYKSTGLITAAGINFPAEFTFTAYEPTYQVSHPEKRLPVYAIHATTKQVRPHVESELFNLVFSGVATVEDERLAGSRQTGGVVYRLTNSAPPSTGDRRLGFLAARAQYLEDLRAKHFRQNLTSRRITVYALTLFVSAIFVVVLLKNKTKQKREEGDGLE